MSDSKTIAERRADAVAAKIAQNEKLDREKEAREVQALELDVKFTEQFGERGVKWDILSNAVGNYAIKLCDEVAAKRFTAVKEPTTEDCAALVTGYVIFPDKERFLADAKEHGGIYWGLAALMQALYSAKGRETAGK